MSLNRIFSSWERLFFLFRRYPGKCTWLTRGTNYRIHEICSSSSQTIEKWYVRLEQPSSNIYWITNTMIPVEWYDIDALSTWFTVLSCRTTQLFQKFFPCFFDTKNIKRLVMRNKLDMLNSSNHLSRLGIEKFCRLFSSLTCCWQVSFIVSLMEQRFTAVKH